MSILVCKNRKKLFTAKKQLSTLLEKCGRISLNVTLLQSSWKVKFSQIEGNDWKFSHIQLSISVIRKIVQQCTGSTPSWLWNLKLLEFFPVSSVHYPLYKRKIFIYVFLSVFYFTFRKKCRYMKSENSNCSLTARERRRRWVQLRDLKKTRGLIRPQKGATTLILTVHRLKKNN